MARLLCWLTPSLPCRLPGDTIEQFRFVCDVCPHLFEELSPGDDHFLRAVHGREPQFSAKLPERTHDSLVLLVHPAALTFIQVVMQRRFDNAIVGTAVLHDPAETVFQRTQFREALQMIGKLFMAGQRERCFDAIRQIQEPPVFRRYSIR